MSNFYLNLPASDSNLLSKLFIFYVCITYQYNLQVYNFHCVNDAENFPYFLLTVLIYFRMNFPVILFLK